MQSHHHLIGLHITLTEFPRGRGYWTFNQSLLDDNLFLTKTKKFINYFFCVQHRYRRSLIVWDTFKCTFKGHSIQYSSLKQKQFRSREIRIIKEIEEATAQADGDGNGTIEVQNRLEGKQIGGTYSKIIKCNVLQK